MVFVTIVTVLEYFLVYFKPDDTHHNHTSLMIELETSY